MHAKPSTAATFLVTALLCLAMAGCGSDGPELSRVEGTVTLDGSPLDGARVEFQPDQGGSPSYGTTDQDGHYELIYGIDRPGALPCRHTVRITTYAEVSDGTGPATVVAERVPPRYNSESELIREVESGSQTLDFPLEGALSE